MNELRIARLTLSNFKGVTDFTLDAGGYSASVMGDNAAGKTTLADAFSWLLFGKDSAGRTDFEIKTLDDTGEPAHGLEHAVEAELILQGGVRQTLRKVFSENWTKPRGAADKVFSGHTTDHYIDGVPVKKGEYDNTVADLADVQAFRLLTDPAEFSERIHWQERRQILLDVCGDVADGDVIASHEALADLPEILGNRSIEDHRKVIQEKRKRVNKERDKLPDLINEVTNGLPDLGGEDAPSLKTRLTGLRGDRRKVETDRAGLTAGGAIAAARARVASLDGELIEIKNAVAVATDASVAEDRTKLAALDGEVADAKREVEAAKRAAQEAADAADAIAIKVGQHRERWNTINDETLDLEQEDTCPACGQAIPEFKLSEAREKALAGFNMNKAEKLEENQAAGRDLVKKLELLERNKPALQKATETAVIHLTATETKAGRVRESIATALHDTPDATEDAAYKAKAREKKAVELEIRTLKAGNDDAATEIAARAAELDEQIETAEALVARIEQREKGEARIEELKAQEVLLGQEFEELERQLFLTEEFVRTKVTLLEDRINARFKLARFSLFKVLVNGGLDETAETTYNGVPWKNLNHGARVRVGLDIIRTLQEHYGFAPPVWLDQGESVTSLPDMSCQLVRLVVSAEDKTLRVEALAAAS